MTVTLTVMTVTLTFMTVALTVMTVTDKMFDDSNFDSFDSK